MLPFVLLVLALLHAPAASADQAPGTAPGELLARARPWLASHPDDGDSWRFAGLKLMEVERFAEAADAFARAAALGHGDAVAQAASLVRLGRMEEARKIAAESVAGKYPRAADRDRAALRLVARALAQSGDVGRARTVLDAALAATPDDAGLLAERGELELDAGHPVHAIAPLEKAAGHRPKDPVIRRSLVRAWAEAGMPVRARMAFDEARAAGVRPDDAMMASVLAAMQAYGDHAKAEAAAAAYLASRPKAAAILRAQALSLAALGAEDRAAAALKQAFRMAPPDAEAIALAEKVLPKGDRESVLADLRRRFPWMPELFRTGGKAPRDLAWPWLAEADRLSAEGKRAEALAQLDQGMGAIPDHASGQRARLLLRRAELEGDVSTALSDLERADAMDVPHGAVLARRTRVLMQAGRWQEAAETAWEWARLRPDDPSALDALFVPEIAERLGWARAFAHLADHVARDPADGDRRLRALERHAGPGGSPLLALSQAQALERLVDGGDPRYERARALSAKVQGALAELGKVTSIAPEDGRLVIEPREGGPMEVRVNPATGRLIRFSDGDRWIAAVWSADGLDLDRIEDSAGNSLAVRRRGGRLAGIEAKGGAAFRADIGADGAPTGIISSLPDTRAVEAYNNALALLSAWPRANLASARWLRLGE